MERTLGTQIYKASEKLVTAGFSPNVVYPSGVRRGAVIVLGEAPGRRESETGIPFHPEADAGGLFTRLLRRAGVDREELCITNCVWQRPPDNVLYSDSGPMWYTDEALAYWQPALRRLIEEIQPPVIIGLGKTALTTLTGFQELEKNRGYVNWASFRTEKPHGPYDFADSEFDVEVLEIPVVCTYHPSYLQRGALHLSGVWLRDVLAALEIAAKGWHRPELKVVPMASLDEFRAGFVAGYNPERHKLTFDIETAESRYTSEDEIEADIETISFEIERISFCYDSEVGGWSVPWVNGFRDEAKALLESLGPKRSWNGRLFDRPRLARYGVGVKGREYDLLDAWRHMHRTLPASLAFVAPFYLPISPWKQEAHTQPEVYSAMDAICEHEVAEGIERDLRATGQLETYERHVVDILALGEQMSKNGIPFDTVRGKEFEKDLGEKLKVRVEWMQSLAPESVKLLDPKGGYKTLPKKIKEQIAAGELRGVMTKKDSKGEPKEFGYTLVEREFQVPWEKLTKAQQRSVLDVQEEPTASQPVTRWTKQLDFNPGSFKQKLQLFKAFGHKPKADRKTKNETSGDETLKSFITKYSDSKKASDQTAVEIYRAIRETQAITKVLGTYVKGWRPGPDGLIHATPGIWGDMFRISWRHPNLAATVSDKKEIQIASGFRTCVACKEDELIIEFDWKGMEAVIVAYLAQDEDYMRLARMGPHSFLASHALGKPADLSWPDERLIPYLKAIKKSKDPHVARTYDDAKHCCHGIAYGATAFLLAELYGMTRKRAQWLIDMFFALFPKVKEWQHRTIQEAFTKTRLTNPWNYTLSFWGVYTWNQKRNNRLRDMWTTYLTKGMPSGKNDAKWIERILAEGGGIPAIDRLSYDLGDDAKSAIAFRPRDIGAAMLKDAMLELEHKHQLASRGILRACVHDSLLTICKRSEAPEVVRQVKEVMQMPCQRLDGLVIEVECSYGKTWDKGAMCEFDLST